MSDYAIFTDGGASMPAGACQEAGILCIPMGLMLDGVPMQITPDQADLEQVCRSYYEALQGGAVVSTSQITPFAYQEAFRPVLESGQDILYCCFSSGLSATWQAALMAVADLADQYPNRTVRCVDTHSAAAGQGLFALRAASNRAAGMTLEDNARELEASALQCCHWFSVLDLDFLKRGGRINPAVAFFGTKMNIRPLLQINTEGKLAVTDKIRGQAASQAAMVKKLEGAFDIHATTQVWIDHAGAPEAAEALAELVRRAAPAAELRIVPLSPIIGAHTGAGMVSICHYGVHR